MNRRSIRQQLTDKEVEEFFASVNASMELKRPIDTAERARILMRDAWVDAELYASKSSVERALSQLW